MHANLLVDADAYALQHQAVDTPLSLVATEYAAHPIGHTAGLKVKISVVAAAFQPVGWHAPNWVSEASDKMMVCVASLYVISVTAYTLVQDAGNVYGVVRAGIGPPAPLATTPKAAVGVGMVMNMAWRRQDMRGGSLIDEHLELHGRFEVGGGATPRTKVCRKSFNVATSSPSA